MLLFNPGPNPLQIMADHWTSVRRRRIETTFPYHSSIFNSTTTCIKTGRHRADALAYPLFLGYRILLSFAAFLQSFTS
jgi:hypothetical protein